MSATLHLQKRDAMLELLDRGLVMVHLDPRVAGVAVPEFFTHEPTLRLNIAYGFNLPALEIDEEGIYAVLSFSGVNHGCTIPWESVFALTLPQDQHEGKMWASCLPPELVESMTAVAEEQAAASPAPVPTLRVVGADEPADQPDAPAESDRDDSAQRPKLRLVTD